MVFRIEYLLIVVLSVDVHPAAAEVSYLAQSGHLAVELGHGLAACHDLTGNDGIPAVSCAGYLDERPVRSGPYHGCVGSVTKHGAYSRYEHGFARAGLAGDDVEPVSQVKGQMLYCSEVVYYDSV